MTKEEVRGMMDAAGIYYDPAHPDHIELGEARGLPPPFLEFEAGESYFAADDTAYFTWLDIEARIYADTDVAGAEGRLKAAFLGNGLVPRTRKEYDEETGLWRTTLSARAPKTG